MVLEIVIRAKKRVDLIGGFIGVRYWGCTRAQVVMFSLTLSFQTRKGPWSPIWDRVGRLFGGLCLLLSGRRKMLGMPLVFLAALALFCNRVDSAVSTEADFRCWRWRESCWDFLVARTINVATEYNELPRRTLFTRRS